MLTVVVLPAPFGPSSEKSVPGGDFQIDAVEHDFVLVGLPQPEAVDREVVMGGTVEAALTRT